MILTKSISTMTKTCFQSHPRLKRRPSQFQSHRPRFTQLRTLLSPQKNPLISASRTPAKTLLSYRSMPRSCRILTMTSTPAANQLHMVPSLSPRLQLKTLSSVETSNTRPHMTVRQRLMLAQSPLAMFHLVKLSR